MSLGNWGENLLKDAVGAFFGSDYLRDYTHASKTFRTNSYENAPKLKFLFHTYFNINTDAFPFQGTNNFGLLVKDIKLPSFNIDTKELNQYNRKRLIYTKINYDPIEITFHDDNGDKINQLWESYYTYYFNDGTKFKEIFAGNRGGARSGGAESYFSRNIYDPSITGDDQWGLSGGGSAAANGTVSTTEPKKKTPFFKNITVFGFNQHNFTAYTLINPVITNFSHDTYAYSEGNGVMQNKMTIRYEAVAYEYGALDGRKPGDIVTGFGDPATYDRTQSPIMKNGANATILGRGGLVDAAGGTIQALREGNILGAVLTAGTAYNTFKNTNLKSTATRELNAMLRNSVQNTPNTRNQLFNFPVAGSSPGPIGTAGYPPIGASGTQISGTAGVQNNGSNYSEGYQNPQGVVNDFPFNPTNPYA